MELGPHIARTLAVVGVPIGAVIGASLLTAGAGSAQTYPSKLIRVISPIPSGSVVDVTVRLVTPALAERLGVPVIVENRPGGGGTTGTKEFARAAPDGYTLLFSGLFSVFAFKTLGYDPIKDFVPIATAATHHWILVVPPALPVTSVKELIGYAKAHPGKLNWGFGQGSSPHMFGELFKAETGIDVASIPYKSGVLAVPDVLGGRIDINFGTVSNLLPLIREGKLRALAITSEGRSPDLPDVPTMAEAGFPRLTRGGWVGLWAPARTPAHIVSRLNADISAIVTTPATIAAMKKLDFEPKVGSPQQFATFILDEVDTWTPVARAAGILSK